MITAANDADHQRVAAAVEQPHHDVAAVAVGAEEELAVRLEPLRADRHAVEGDHVRRLPSTLIVSVRWFSYGVVWATLFGPDGAATQDSTSATNRSPKKIATLLRRRLREAELPRPHPVDAVAFGFLLPGRGALEASRFG